MKTVNEFKEAQTKQNQILDSLSKLINKYPKDSNGLIIESVRFSEEYKTIQKQFNIEFKKLQNINSVGVKKFKKELKSYDNRRNKKIT